MTDFDTMDDIVVEAVDCTGEDFIVNWENEIMGESRVILKVQPDVKIGIDSIGGDCVIEGYDGDEFLAVGEGPHLDGSADSGAILFFSEGGCRLRVPRGAWITIDNIGGSASFANLDNELSVDNVGGDASVANLGNGLNIDNVGSDFAARNVGALHVNNISGDLAARGVQGDVKINEVSGDASLKDVGGDVTIDDIGGDLALKALGATSKVQVDNVNGDLVVVTTFGEMVNHQFGDISGDAVFKVGEEADVRFVIPTDATRVIRIKGAQISTEDDEGGESIVLKDGKATVTIDDISGEFLLVREGDSRFGDFDVESFTEEFTRNFNWSWDEVAERARREAQRAMERLNERIQRHQERVEERHGHKRKRGFSVDLDFGKGKFKIPVRPAPPTPPQPPAPPSFRKAEPANPVTDDERMLILRMVEAKQISVEEAERLFAALEGKE